MWLTDKSLRVMFQKAMDVKELPRSFEIAIHTLSVLPPDMFKYVQPLRRVVFNEIMSPTLGVYFSTRLETTPIYQPEWRQLGWDGEDQMMIFPTSEPEEWVILHEFGHYLDDVLVRALNYRQYGFSLLYPSRVEEFMRLKSAMWKEYTTTRALVKETMTDKFGEKVFTFSDWWKDIPRTIVPKHAVSHYACLTYSEWFAESFQTWLRLSWSRDLIPPKTAAFMEFLTSGELFSQPELSRGARRRHYKALNLHAQKVAACSTSIG